MNRFFREEIGPYDKNKAMSVDDVVKLVAEEKGRESSRRLFVENLLKESSFPAEKIASLANVTVEFVMEVKAALKGK